MVSLVLMRFLHGVFACISTKAQVLSCGFWFPHQTALLIGETNACHYIANSFSAPLVLGGLISTKKKELLVRNVTVVQTSPVKKI